MQSPITVGAGEFEGDRSESARLGAVIRQLRREKGMSLQALSELSGVSAGMLSQVERGLVNPSVRVLTSVRAALGAPVNVLFGEVERGGADTEFVTRAGQRPSLNLGGVRKELLSGGGAHNLQMMILHIEPGGSSGDAPISYPAEKGGMVLQGELLLRVGKGETLLREGDSFIFDSSLPHSFRNPGTTPAKVIWIIGSVPLDRHL